jgi:poly(3-hydroxybutyrate) depolymerase
VLRAHGPAAPAGRREPHAVPAAPPEKPPLDYALHLPGSARRGAPLLVVLPPAGVSPPRAVRARASWAERCGVVLLAPLLGRLPGAEAGDPARPTEAARADLALLALVDEVVRFSGAGSAQIHLFGMGCGGDFAHRFLLAHPERVAAAVVASARRFTFPEAAATDVDAALGEALEVPILVTAGPDEAGHAAAWVDAMCAAARELDLPPLTLFEPDPGDAKLLRRVFEFCFGLSAPA